MIPWVHIDSANIPGDNALLRLMQRGGEFSIMLGTNELMNSRVTGSEERLADLACGKICDRPRATVLVGGLGMGFTLRAALAALGADAQLIVAELIPAVAAWARGPLAPLFGDSLGDPRVVIYECDVGQLIRASVQSYDAILLDVDNGPEGLTRMANDSLYSSAGLAATRSALRPGGVLAVWSAGPSPEFTRRLKNTGLAVEEIHVRARRSGRGARHVIWLATSPGS